MNLPPDRPPRGSAPRPLDYGTAGHTEPWWRRWEAVGTGALAAAPSVSLWFGDFLWQHYGISAIWFNDCLFLLMATAGPYLAMVTIGLAKAAPEDRDASAVVACVLAAVAILGTAFVVIAWFLIVPALLLGGWTAHWIYQRRRGGRFMP